MLASQTMRIKHYRLEQLKCDEWLALQIINTTLERRYDTFLEAVKSGVVPCEIYNAFYDDKIEIHHNDQMYYCLENHAVFQRKMEEFKYDGQDLFKDPPLQQAVSTLARAIVVVTHEKNSQIIDLIMHEGEQALEPEEGDEEEEFIDIPADSVEQFTIGVFAPHAEHLLESDEEKQEADNDTDQPQVSDGEKDTLNLAEEADIGVNEQEEEPISQKDEELLQQMDEKAEQQELIELPKEESGEKEQIEQELEPLKLESPVDEHPESVEHNQEGQQGQKSELSVSNPPDFQTIQLPETPLRDNEEALASASTLAFPLPAPEPNLKTIVSKIALIGPAGSGKTSLLKRLAGDEFSPVTQTTAALDSVQLHFSANNTNYNITAYDTAGEDKFSTVMDSQVHKAELVLLCYDVSSADDLSSLDTWLSKSGKSGSKVILCGLECDKQATVTEKEINDYCKKHGIEKSVICSNKTGAGISYIFEDIWLIGQEDGQIIVIKEPQVKRGCCQ